jgi:glycosyltransferase involved in cell wall biosynthesis
MSIVEPGVQGFDHADLSFDWRRSQVRPDPVADDRITLITKVIVPFAKRHLPSSSLFISLKECEVAALASGRALPSFEDILSCLSEPASASRDGDESPLRLPSAPAGGRVVRPEMLFKAVLSMALHSPSLLVDLRRRYGARGLQQVLNDLSKIIPVYLVCTNQGYPLGGAESFMQQTCRIMHEFGFSCVWVSFINSQLENYRESSVAHTPYYIDVREAGGITQKRVDAAVQRWAPDVIHSQADANNFVAEAASRFRIPALVGYHFWNGLINLGPLQNQKIVQNAARHSLAAPTDAMADNSVTRYIASEFMADVYQKLGGTSPLAIFHPIPDPAHYQTNQTHLGDFVLQVNIASGKGGPTLLECIKRLGSRIPFFAVRTEPLSEGLDRKIKEALEKAPRSVYAEFGSMKDYYAQARLVLIPTLVDETFCRVAFEAAMNGVPVLCTRNGFLPYMFGDTGVYLSEDWTDWSRAIESLYWDFDRLRRIGAAQKAYVQKRYGNSPEKFMAAALSAIAASPKRNVGFFTAWAEQGLGHQTRHYAKLLRRAGYRTHVFSFQPYSASGKSLVTQHDPQEWSAPAHADSVHYSFNGREHVTVNELDQFIRANRVGTLLCPEICWETNWKRLKSLSVANLAICAVPNIEIVRGEEADRHDALDRTWYNTRIAEKILRNAGVRNGVYIGHGFGEALSSAFVREKIKRSHARDHIALLHVGGHNPIGRKQTHLVIKAFAKAARHRKDIHLTVTVMGAPVELQRAGDTANITFIDQPLNHAQILDLYEQCDASIQVSSHEGLGLGFYESISRGTPVISLDVPPHNEVILDGETGWLLSARSKPVPDNDDALVSAASFDVEELACLLTELSRNDIGRVIESTCRLFSERFDELPFLVRVLSAMPHRAPAQKPALVDAPPRCFMQQPGFFFRAARAAARSCVPKSTRHWLRPAMRAVRAFDRRLLALRVLIFRPPCCRDPARRHKHGICFHHI